MRAAFLLAWVAVMAPLVLIAQEPPSQVPSALPQSLRQLSPAEFASAALEMLDSTELTPEARSAIEQQAAILLSQVDFQSVEAASFPLLYDLHRVAGGAFGKSEQQRLRSALESRTDNWANRPYEEIRGKIALMVRAKMHFKAYNEAQRWLAAGGTYDKIVQTEQGRADLENPYAPLAVKVFFGNAQKVLGSFSVVWEARVAAPNSGAYRFSISPINVSGEYRDYYVKQTMSVVVGGNPVIAASPEAWNSLSAPVNLTAGQAVSLRVEATFETRTVTRGVLHAMLYWEGPGVAKAIVPFNALYLPGENTHGLSGAYRFRDGAQERVVTQIDRGIDFAWPLGGLVVAGDAAKNQMADEIANVLWNKMTSADLLNQLEQTGGLHPLLEAAESGAGNFSSDRRGLFLDTLVARPALLDPVSPEQMFWLFRAFRLGAEEEALATFGAWSARHASDPCKFPDNVQISGHDLVLRDVCRQLSICVTQELPEQRAQLRDQFLELQDGGCSLPVAYTLGYGYQSVGESQQWREFLDQKLADDGLTGDRRVNWLIARAHAEEIRLGPQKPYVVISERIMDGRGYLDEAQLVASTPAVRMRAARELAARLAALGQFDAARTALDQAAAAAGAQSGVDVAAWKQDVQRWQAQVEASLSEEKAAAEASYRETLLRRRESAAANGNSAAVSRYDALLESLTPE